MPVIVTFSDHIAVRPNNNGCPEIRQRNVAMLNLAVCSAGQYF